MPETKVKKENDSGSSSGSDSTGKKMNSNSGNDLYHLNVTNGGFKGGAAQGGGANAQFELSSSQLQGDHNNSNSGGTGMQSTQQQDGSNGGALLTSREGVSNTATATATASAAAATAPTNFNPRASIHSSVTSVTTDDDAISDAYRRVSKESLASNESLHDMLPNTNGATMEQQQQLLNLLQRQQLQMGNLSMSNHHPGAAAFMAMMMQQQQQQQGLVVGGAGGTASHRNSLTGATSSTTSNNTFQMGQDSNTSNTNMNAFLLNNMNNFQSNNSSTTTTTTTTTNNNNPTGPLFLIPPKKSKNKQKQTFAMKLMNILSLKECQSAIRWMPNGQAFCVVNADVLVEKVLPVYFKEAKYTSFTRKLNRWGFKHYSLPINKPSTSSSSDPAEKEMSIYSHEKFLRDDPELCQTMDGGHRRRNARKDEERTRQFFSQLKPEVRDLLRQGKGLGGSGGGVAGVEGGGGDEQVQSIAKQVGVGGVAGTNQTTLGLEAQLQQMQAVQLHLLQQQQQQQLQQQQQQQQQQQNPSNQMMDMSSFMSNNAAALAMGGNANSLLASAANQQGLMGMMGATGGGGGRDTNVNAMAAAAMTAAAQGGPLNNTLGMRRTSLGFMPYLPTTNVGGFGRRDSLGSVFSMGNNNHMYDGKIESTFDDNNGAGANTMTGGIAGAGKGEQKEGYEPGTSSGATDQTSKLELLQGMIANEARQRLMENGTANNEAMAASNENFMGV